MATASVLAAFASAVLAATAAAGIVPAIDEYSLRPPSADGKAKPGGQPQAQPTALKPAVQKQLPGAEDGATLGTIATAEELGAPAPASGGSPQLARGSVSPEERSLPAAALSALGEPWGIAIALALALLGAFAIARLRAGTE